MYTINTSNITVMVKDMNAAVNFYVEGLGLSLKQRWGDHYAQVTAPGVVIGLHPTDKTIDRLDAISIGFGIDKLADAEQRLRELGVVYKNGEDKGGLYASFHDPDGTPLYFMQSKIGNW